MRPVHLLRTGLAVLAVTTALAAAQTAAEVLKQSSDALIDAGTLRAKLTIHGDGPDMFKSAMPTGEVALLIRREAGDEENGIDPSWTTRITGQTTTGNATEKDPIKVDIVATDKLLRWLDHGQKKLFESTPDRALTTRSTGYSAARSLILTEILTSRPFSEELDAEELELLEPAEVHGVACDIVQVTYAPTTARSTRAATHNIAKIAISKSDHLPRRIERVSGSGAFTMSIILELTDLKPHAEITDQDLEIKLPEGYEIAAGPQSRVINPTARVTTTRPVDGSPPAQADNKPLVPAETYSPAPDFSTKLASGDTLSLETLRGKVGVLYYWGTWSMECRPFSPLVSKLNDEYTDKGVRVIGMAVRERDPKLAVDTARTRDYTFELAPSATDTTDTFKIVVYPTFVVIDAQGRLIGTEHARREAKPDDVMARVRGLITKALGQDPTTPDTEPEADPEVQP